MKAKQVRLTLRLEEVLSDNIDAEAYLQDLSKNQLINKIIREYFQGGKYRAYKWDGFNV